MFIIAGPPGAGKTTQCQLLEEKYDFIWISAGNLLRTQAHGKERETMLKGELVDDEFVDHLVDTELDKHADKQDRVLLDGFPRDFHEARWMVEEHGALIRAYVLIEVSEPVIRERLHNRGRIDDTDEVITERIRVFHEETEGIVNYFADEGIPIVRVNGDQDVEAVHHSIIEALGIA